MMSQVRSPDTLDQKELASQKDSEKKEACKDFRNKFKHDINISKRCDFKELSVTRLVP